MKGKSLLIGYATAVTAGRNRRESFKKANSWLWHSLVCHRWWELVETEIGQGKASVKKECIAMHASKSFCSANSSTRWAVILLFSNSPLEDTPWFCITRASMLSRNHIALARYSALHRWNGGQTVVFRGSAWINWKVSCRVDAVSKESKSLQASRFCTPAKQIVGSRQTQVLSYKTSMRAFVNALTTQCIQDRTHLHQSAQT